ncbi:hypothetical protein [Companilactobacillus keshanensis]|uniref:DUF3899 domain-containing protein n=1 Tax=Companilactobacillus keshanensis TaxID=2486003 RepID=A0ABW4BUZ6_9LACO|nr:hypothetical protein [Companilactobacillus keshanensis]
MLNNLLSKVKGVFSKSDKSKYDSVVPADQVEKRQQELRDRERQRVEEDYRQTHPDQIMQEKMESFENKTNKLKKKLNIAIITVFGLIVIVFLILFFI